MNWNWNRWLTRSLAHWVSGSIRNQQVFRAGVESIFPAQNPLFFSGNARKSLRTDTGRSRVGGKGVTECLRKSAREHLRAEHHVALSSKHLCLLRPAVSGVTRSAHGGSQAENNRWRPWREKTALPWAEPSSGFSLQTETQAVGQLSGEEGWGAHIHQRLAVG